KRTSCLTRQTRSSGVKAVCYACAATDVIVSRIRNLQHTTTKTSKLCRRMRSRGVTLTNPTLFSQSSVLPCRYDLNNMVKVLPTKGQRWCATKCHWELLWRSRDLRRPSELW